MLCRRKFFEANCPNFLPTIQLIVLDTKFVARQGDLLKMTNYATFFQRPDVVSDDWKDPIVRPKKEDRENGKLGQLHHDIFGHHHGPIGIETFRQSLSVQDDASRAIAEDNLTDFYLNSNLTVPIRIYECEYISGFDSDQLEDYAVEEAVFVRLTTDVPFVKAAADQKILGSNRMTYLLGDVGAGKSFLCAKIISHLQKQNFENPAFKNITIKICFEALRRSEMSLEELGLEFLTYFYERIDDAAVEILQTQPSDKSTLKTEAAIFREIKKLLVLLAQSSYRIVVIFDNIDGLHYPDSRYLFFEVHYDKLREKLNATINKLTNVFSDPALLGNAGLCVVIVARENVARDCWGAADPAVAFLKDRKIFWLKNTAPEEIIESRFALLDKAMEVIAGSESLSGRASHSWRDGLAIFKNQLRQSAKNSAAGVGVIWNLCQHGNRSLVEFIGSLRINYYFHEELSERL